MDYVGSLWKRDYKWSLRGSSSPKTAAKGSKSTGTKDKSNSDQIIRGSPRINIDASREDALARGASVIESIQNSPRHEKPRALRGDYDDVFGGPPRYAFSKHGLQVPVQGLEEALRKPFTLSPGWKDSDFPVFGSSAQDNVAFDSVSGRRAIMEDLYKGRLTYASGFHSDRSAAATPRIRQKVPSRSSSCAQSPARAANSVVKDRALDEFLLASVHLKIDPKDVISPREATKVASIYNEAYIPGRASAQDNLYDYNELIVGNEEGAECKGVHATPSKSRTESFKDYQDFDDSSQLIVQDKDSNTFRHQSDGYTESSYVDPDNLSLKKLPRVSPAPLHPDSAPRLKNQKSLLRRKFGMEPSEDSSTEAYVPSLISKEGSASPSLNSLSTASVKSTISDSVPKAHFSEKLVNTASEQHVTSSSRVKLEVLDKNIMKNRLSTPRSRDFDLFASAVAAIKKTESQFKAVGIARQEEKRDSVSSELKVSEKHGSIREQSCMEDKDSKMKSSSVIQETVDSSKDKNAFKRLSKDTQEREAKFSSEVLEKEELEAREAVERERRLREEQKQKDREKQEARESLRKVFQEVNEFATIETPDVPKRVASDSFNKGTMKPNEQPLAGEKSVANKKLEVKMPAQSQVIAGKRAEAENFINSAEEADVTETVLDVNVTETVEKVHNAFSGQKLANQSEGKQSTFKSTSIDKGGDKKPAFRPAEYGFARARVDKYPPTSDFHVSEDNATEKRTACADLNQQTSSHLGFEGVLDEDIKKWSSGKERNLRALLSTLQYVLWPDSGWQPVRLTDIISPISVKKVYKKATLYVHPDKMQQKGASLQQKYIADKVFFLLKEAWNTFNSEEFL